MFKFAMYCQMDKYDSTKLAIFGLIQIWECALDWFTVELVHERLLDICHLRSLGATYPKHVLYWSPCANDSQLIWKFAWHSKVAYSKHLSLGFLVGHVLVSVNPCGRCAVVAPLPPIAKLSLKFGKIGFRIYELIWVGIFPFFWMRVKICHLEMIWVEFQSKNQPQFNF